MFVCEKESEKLKVDSR